MKQRLTIDQLKELSVTQKERLREWWKPSEGDRVLCENYGIVTVHHNRENEDDESEEFTGPVWINCGYSLIAENPIPILSIGQMCEFLYDNTNDWGIHYNDSGVFYTVYRSWNMETARLSGRLNRDDELCDALWEAVKKTLGE